SAEPRTNPPPVTRSNSARPVTTRAALSVSPASGTRLAGRPLERAAFGPAPTPESTTSSTIEFHSPQASHRPCQRLDTAPQAWHKKEVFVLATIASCAGWRHPRGRASRNQEQIKNKAPSGRQPPIADIGAVVAALEVGQQLVADGAGGVGLLVQQHVGPEHLGAF